jgi:hypothetical protein
MIELKGSFTRLQCEHPIPAAELLRALERLQERAIQPLAPQSETDREVGWATLAHPLNVELTLEQVRFNEYVGLTYRIDTFRVPPRTLKLQQAEAELQWLAENHRESMPRGQRRSLREQVARELRNHTVPTLQTIPVIWNVDLGDVWIWSQSRTLVCDIADLFRESFSVQLLRCGAEERAQRAGQAAKEPWNLTGPLRLGPEFLGWLWFQAEQLGGWLFQAEQGEEADCTYGFEGKLQLEDPDRGTVDHFRTPEPTQLEEARAALRLGRVVTWARLWLKEGERDYAFTLHGSTFDCKAVKLPTLLCRGEEEQFFEQLYLMEELDRILGRLFDSFLQERTTPRWEAEVLPAMERWIEHPAETSDDE